MPGIIFDTVKEPRPRRRRPLGFGGLLAVVLVLVTSTAIAALAVTSVVWATFWLITHFPTL